MPSEPWTQEEDRIIIEHYPSIGVGVSSILTLRTSDSIGRRARKLGVRVKPGAGYHHNLKFGGESDDFDLRIAAANRAKKWLAISGRPNAIRSDGFDDAFDLELSILQRTAIQ